MSRGGKTIKIHALVDALGTPVKLLFTSRNIHDNKVAIPVMTQVDIARNIMMGDKDYGTQEI